MAGNKGKSEREYAEKITEPMALMKEERRLRKVHEKMVRERKGKPVMWWEKPIENLTYQEIQGQITAYTELQKALDLILEKRGASK